MICLEEKEKFIVFSCKHKTCTDCFPLLIMYSSPCPICDVPIQIPTRSTYKLCLGCCMTCLFGYIIFSIQKNF